MRTPLRMRRLFYPGRRSENPDVAILQQELEEKDRQLRDTLMLVDKLRAECTEKAAEAESLSRLGEATGSVFDLEEMLKATAEIAIRLTGTDSCQVYLYDKTRDELVLRAADETATNMIGKIHLKLGEGITGWVARERKHVAIVRNATRDHRFKYFSEIHEEEYESILSVPLIFRNEVLGVINVRTKHPHEYTLNQVRLLSGIANQVAGAIDKTRRARLLEKTADQLHTLSEVSQAITSNVYLNDILELFVKMTARTMNYKVCTVLLLDQEKNELVIKATQSDDPAYTNKPNLKVGESLAGRAVMDGKVVTVLDVKKHPRYKFPDIAERAGLCSLAAIPLMFQGKAIGILNCYTDKPHTFTKEEITILQALGAQAAFAVEHAKLMVKSAVIQEMHHRVKNNLQQIASLVRLQMHFSKGASVEETMNDTLNRILAIAAVHELLSREDLDSVSVKKVSEQILTATKQSVVAPGKSLYTLVEGPDIRLPLNQATSLALVINELVQNAVEHGFATIDEGRIWVKLEETDSEIALYILNHGQPLPENFDPVKTSSLGLRIVMDLVRGGLGGTFVMENKDGILATVRFPKA